MRRPPLHPVPEAVLTTVARQERLPERSPRRSPESQVPGVYSLSRHLLASVRATRSYWQAVPRLRHSLSSQRKVVPDLQMVDCVATVAPLYIQGRASGAWRAATSPPPVHAIPRPCHTPSLQRYWVPD